MTEVRDYAATYKVQGLMWKCIGGGFVLANVGGLIALAAYPSTDSDGQSSGSRVLFWLGDMAASAGLAVLLVGIIAVGVWVGIRAARI